MSIEDEATQAAEVAEFRGELIDMARVAILVGAGTSRLYTELAGANMPADLIHDLVMQAGMMLWHDALCCGGGSEGD